MDSKKRVTISWSGGKDSALALFKVLRSDECRVEHLHTVINAETKRVGLHGVHEKMIEAQAASLGIRLVKLYLPASEDHQAYNKLMESFYNRCVSDHIDAVVFGDIFLEDLRAYREEMLMQAGLRGIYPLWKMSSRQLMQDFLSEGFRTILCSANAKYFLPEALGKTIDLDFIDNLMPSVDVAGENGEFHSFVYDGPIFSEPIAWRPGQVVKKTYSYKVKGADGGVESAKADFWFKELYEG